MFSKVKIYTRYNSNLYTKSSTARNTVILYSPVYYSSYGTKYRISLIAKSLRLNGYNPVIISLERETGINKDIQEFLKFFYYKFGDKLINHRYIFYLIGEIQYRILKKIINKYKSRINSIILFTDMAAPVGLFLRKYINTNIIVSIEDISHSYLSDIKTQDVQHSKYYYASFFDTDIINYYNMLCDILHKGSDFTITPSIILARSINKVCNIKSIPIPIGIDVFYEFLDLKDLIDNRIKRNIHILLAGQLFNVSEFYNTVISFYMLNKLVDNLKFIVLDKGKYNMNVKKFISNLKLYNYNSYIQSMKQNIKYHLGWVVSSRRSFTLSRLYYHTMLLQPIVMYDKFGFLKKEAELNNIYITNVTECIDGRDLDCLGKKVEYIIDNYNTLIKEQMNYNKKLKIPDVHKDLIKLIS